MKYRIQGTTMPSLDVQLKYGESIYTESGGMAWMQGELKMKTNTRGGLWRSITRVFGGESFFLTSYTCEDQRARITFTSEFIGSIVPLELAQGESRICQKDAFMAAEDSVELRTHLRKKLGAGLFGGQGFILQKIEGPGVAWIEVNGDVREIDLARGESIRVDPLHTVMHEPSVTYDIKRIKGVRNILFGGEGLFLAHLTGPGKVWLQTMPFTNIAAKVSYVHSLKSNRKGLIDRLPLPDFVTDILGSLLSSNE